MKFAFLGFFFGTGLIISIGIFSKVDQQDYFTFYLPERRANLKVVPHEALLCCRESLVSLFLTRKRKNN